MTNFPVPLDNLITYVLSLHPEGDPLEHLSDAVAVGHRLDEQSDALLGHFVDQARRAGASWSQIGSAMGVSKQAVQKRFVPRSDDSDPIPEAQLYSRLTQRAADMVATARQIATALDATDVDATHLAAALPSQPEGLAARILHTAGVEDERLLTAFGVTAADAAPSPAWHADAASLRQLTYTDDAKEVLRCTLKAALRLGHNYIGTEHLLLGILFAEGAAARTLGTLGITAELAEEGVSKELQRLQRDRSAT
jgi:ATP-dependent Clp protease ATP-binding subunit ClpA